MGNRNFRACEVDIIEDKGPSRFRNTILIVGGDDALWCSGKFAIKDQNRAYCLVKAPARHVHTHATVVDADRFECPCPVPVHEHCCIAVIKREVAGGKLLVAQKGTIVTAIKDEVCHEATRAIVHKNTLLSIGFTAALYHLETDVLKAASLRHLPMDASTRSLIHARQVDNKISNGPEEVVLVGIPVSAGIGVWIGIDHSNSLKRGGCFDDWHSQSIADELSIVILDNWLGYDICACGEIDNRGGHGRRVTAQSTSISC